jgi:dipeptidyl aminopeptidase/acylaminoacyl peptidase
VLQLPGAEQRVVAWLDLQARALTRLTPGLGADAQYAGQAEVGKPAVLIGVRHPSTSSFRLQAVTPGGSVLAEWESPGRPATGWLASATQAIAVHAASDGCEWWHTPLADVSWSRVLTLPECDARLSRPLAFSADGRTLFALSPAGRDTVALLAMSPPDWAPRMLSADERFDIESVLMSPDGTGPELVTTADPVTPQRALTGAATASLAKLRELADGPATIVSRNSTHCLAEVSAPVGGPAFVTIGRGSQDVSKSLARFSRFARTRIQPRQAIEFRARDGLLLTGFITRPDGPPPWPAVLAIHDGPWSRDLPALDPWSQALGAAGLCCIQVNYRGSRGFGKSFRDAGDGQWSLAMQSDLVDALRCDAVAGLIDQQRIAAIGYGYGGYAALMLATQSEVPLASAGAASAPTDLVHYVTALQSLGGSGLARAARIGDPRADAGRLRAASPLTRAADINVPVLLFHGRQDAQAPVSDTRALAEALQNAGQECELTIYEDEGHRYVRPQNLADLRARTTDFLVRSLRAGPVRNGLVSNR